jgi:hypothetical protein
MEISTTTNDIYSSISTLQTSTNQNNSNTFDIYLSNQTQETLLNTPTKETFKVVAFIDKYNGFSSLSSIDEKIFRDILSDDKLTLEEIKSLSYEQVKKIDNFLVFGFTSGISPDEIPLVKSTDFKIGAMVHATKMTDNEDFNKALFETVQTIDDQMECMNFFDKLSDNLGWNDKTCLIPERDDPELRKNSTKQNWEILDYKKFIEASMYELNELLKNQVIPNEDKMKYQELLNIFTVLQKNHNEIITKQK